MDIVNKVIPVLIAGLFFGGLPALYALSLAYAGWSYRVHPRTASSLKLSLRERRRRLLRSAFCYYRSTVIIGILWVAMTLSTTLSAGISSA